MDDKRDQDDQELERFKVGSTTERPSPSIRDPKNYLVVP